MSSYATASDLDSDPQVIFKSVFRYFLSLLLLKSLKKSEFNQSWNYLRFPEQYNWVRVWAGQNSPLRLHPKTPATLKIAGEYRQI